MATNWRASVIPNGNPGAADSTTFPGGDGAALLNYAAGPASPVGFLPDGRYVFSLNVNPRADDVVGVLEISTDLRSWESTELLLERTQSGR